MKPILTLVVLASALLVGSSFAAQNEPMSTHMGKFDEQSMQMHNDRMEMHLDEMQALCTSCTRPRTLPSDAVYSLSIACSWRRGTHSK